MLVVRILLNSRQKSSTESPLVLSCYPQNLNPTHSKLHADSLEGETAAMGHTNHLAQFDRPKVAAVEGNLGSHDEENFIKIQFVAAFPAG